MKQKIVLHIGYGKTGSSAIQSVLAKNHALLKSEGVLYAEHPSFAEASQGRITSGNLDPEHWFEGQVIATAAREPGYRLYLFSNENIFHRMDEFVATASKYADRYEFEIILFVREPLERLNSAYQQAVKRRGFTGDIREVAEHDRDLPKAASLLAELRQLNIAFKIFNYSTTRRDTVKALLSHLSLWDLIAREGDADVGAVNRSLTAAEANFILYVNQIFGAEYGALLSDALVNQLPEVAADPVPIDDGIKAYLRAKNMEAAEQLNRFLAPSDRLTLDMDAASPPARWHEPLNPRQVDVIRKTFPSALTPADGITLRDIAMKYERAEPLTRDDAVALMEYAQKARPHGQIIAGKLNEWRKSGKSS